MGMLSSLTSVVQSTVSNMDERAVFSFRMRIRVVFCAKAAVRFKNQDDHACRVMCTACKWLIQSHCSADILRTDTF